MRRVERAAFSVLHAMAPEQRHEAPGRELAKVGTALVAIAAREPSALPGGAIGLGVEGWDVRETVFEVALRCRAAGARRAAGRERRAVRQGRRWLVRLVRLVRLGRLGRR